MLIILYANMTLYMFWVDDLIPDFFFLDHRRRMWYYLAWWHISAVLVLVLRSSFNQVRNYFRLECPLSEATHVLIWTPAVDAGDFASVGSIKKVLQFFKIMSDRYLPKPGTYTTLVVQRSSDNTPTFVHQLQRYVYSDSENIFVCYGFQVGSQMKDYASQSGLGSEAAAARMQKVGPNNITIPIPTVAEAILEEYFQTFYVYQYFIIICFFFSYYVTVGSLLISIVIVSGAVQIYLKRESQKKVSAMVVNKPSVVCKRDGDWRHIRCDDIVPGDLIGVEQGLIPCDLVLVKGSVVVDESMLTGESMPVAKAPVESSSTKHYDPVHGKKHTLYCGTHVQGKAQSEEKFVIGEEAPVPKNIAVVDKTGINTSKGDLISGILNPTVIRFKFDEHLQVVMLCLAFYAVVVFFCTMIQMGLVGDPNGWFYGMYRVVTVIPILLPTVFVVAASRGAKQLTSVKVYCTAPSRIMMAGKVRVWCFDKTGTLTKPGLEFMGCQPVSELDEKKSTFGPVTQNTDSWPKILKYATATAHELTERDGCFIGNSVDMKMFTGCGWKLGLPNGEKPESKLESKDAKAAMENDQNWVYGPDGTQLCILKRCQFDHARMTMASIVLDPSTGRQLVFVKGAYESISGLCDDGLPGDYVPKTQKLARSGNYVLGIAYKVLDEKENFADVDRDSLESGLTFVGLIIFRNVPKPDTKDAIQTLTEGDVRPVMITGDNELTGVHIAKECSLIPDGIDDKNILTGRMKEGKVEWVDEDDKVRELPNVTQYGSRNSKEAGLELAMTGAVFRYLKENKKFTPDMLNCCRVFARMKPQDKVDCVYLYMKLGVVGMCGDGGNDCGALRAAHVGVALSDAEASIVSPFSSNNHSIQSIVDVIRFGRSTLASSFSTYKCMVLWGQVCTTLALFKNYYFISMIEINWIIIDAVLCISLSSALTLSKPSNTLSNRRPTISLLGASTLASTVGLIGINFIFTATTFVLLSYQDWYTQFDYANIEAYKWWLLSENPEAAIMFILMISQINNSAAVFNYGDVFRQSWIRNWVLVVVWLTFNIFVGMLVLLPDSDISCYFAVNCHATESYFPASWRTKFMIIIVSNAFTVFAWERVVVLGPVAAWFRNRTPRSKFVRL